MCVFVLVVVCVCVCVLGVFGARVHKVERSRCTLSGDQTSSDLVSDSSCGITVINTRILSDGRMEH